MNIIYNCCSDNSSSGWPILKQSNKIIIGIHKEGIKNKNYNRGTYIAYPINEYLNNLNNEN